MDRSDLICREKFFLALDQHELNRQESYRIRHQVYCVEHEYEEISETRIEKDRFDDHAMHAVVHRMSDLEGIGTLRIIYPHGDIKDTFPMQEFNIDFTGIPLETTGEISRFSVSKKLRDKTDGLARMALVKCLYQLSANFGLTHWCAMMEPIFLRLLARSGIVFQNAGDPIEHRGIRQPVVGFIPDVLAGMKVKNYLLWRYITDRDPIDF